MDMRTLGKADYALQSVHGLRLEWEKLPFRTPGKKDKPLR
jgi:hypothetical protein